ncbi:hypothetical protein CONLIGDRAFT_2601 [Coniochaeta ligniaria NRRL 30616]|uniref:Uncharacterized protein n=1 Tax=Coniochaeta ligniaria NRRL 30616 TaxID=1408157 RepID=A0A1J7JWF1_9PEZI|nr:hypothetical protein CONLIGDRAFT_2601 [Coniochaeta ligniaria NRRL 30616]
MRHGRKPWNAVQFLAWDKTILCPASPSQHDLNVFPVLSPAPVRVAAHLSTLVLVNHHCRYIFFLTLVDSYNIVYPPLIQTTKMRFTTVLLSGLVAVATAQTTTTTTPTTLSTATSTTSESVAETSQSEIVKCIDACPAGDVGCTAKCIAVPNPDPAAVNATNTCVAACPQGNGTATDNLNYQNCVDACIGKYYFTATTAGAPQTTSSGAGVVVTTTDRNGATVTSTIPLGLLRRRVVRRGRMEAGW